MGQQTLLKAGDLCYYWRDAPAGSTAKLRWDTARCYFVQLLCPDGSGPHREGDRPSGLCQAGFAEHQEQRTQYIDLGKTNKRRGDKKWTLKMKKEKMTETEILFKSTNYLQINGSPATIDECGHGSTMSLEGASTFLNLLLRYLYTSSSLSGRPASAVGLRIQNISGFEMSGKILMVPENFTNFGLVPQPSMWMQTACPSPTKQQPQWILIAMMATNQRDQWMMTNRT